MCGFSGIAFIDDSASGQFLPGLEGFRRAANRIAHRGDTEYNEALLNSLWLAHYRLAFQDIKSGKQPMLSHDRKHIIVFNGELYNHNRLREKIAKKSNIVFKTRFERVACNPI